MRRKVSRVKPLVFCTAIAEYRDRCRDWRNHYYDLFDGNVDLLIVADGPFEPVAGTKSLQFDKRLGRRDLFVFPGWLRSFSRALEWADEQGYSQVLHVESDCWIRSSGKAELIAQMRLPEYATAFCRQYNFPEAAVQVVNSPDIRRRLAANFRTMQYEKFCIENFIKEKFDPRHFLKGTRHEGIDRRIEETDTYVGNCTYEDFIRLSPDEIM